MSLSEIFDRGEDHRFANLRVNNISFNDPNSDDLNNYKDLTQDITFFLLNNGPWASPQIENVDFVRVGNKVTLYIPDTFANGNNQAGSFYIDIPEQFRPADTSERTYFARVGRNGSISSVFVVAILNAAPNQLIFYKNSDAEFFDASTGPIGIFATDFSWYI